MATATDVVHNIAKMTDGLAERHATAPTGVEPGYNAALGATVTPDGRLRYVSPPAASPALTSARILARCRSAAVQNVTSGAIDVIQFNTKVYDPSSVITIGASWHFTAPADGWYSVAGWVPVNEPGGGNTYDAGDIMYVEVYVNGSSGHPFALDTLFFGADTTDADSYYILKGAEYYLLDTGDTVALKFENGTSQTRRIGEASAGGAAYITIIQFGAFNGTGAGGTIGPHASQSKTGGSVASGGSTTITTFTTTVYDNFSEVSAGIWVCGATGTFTIAGAVASSGVASWAGGDTFSVELWKANGGGSLITVLDSETGPQTGDISLSGTATGVSLTAGDYLALVVKQTRGDAASVTLGASTLVIDQTA